MNYEEHVKRFLSDFNISQPALTMCKVEDQTNGQLEIQQGHSFKGFRKCCMKHCEGKENRQPGKDTEYRASINFRYENPMAKCNYVLNEKRVT